MSRHARKCIRRGYPETGREVQAMHELHNEPYVRCGSRKSHSKSNTVGTWYDGKLSVGVRSSLAKRMKELGWLIFILAFVSASVWLYLNVSI